jgi:probable phosphoglycerate mutase
MTNAAPSRPEGLTLLLIRHGETDWVGKRLAGRLPDVHLNERGRRQADDLARYLGAVKLRAVFASPLDRAQETAAPLARMAGLTVRNLALLEEGDFGELTGKSFEDVKDLAIWKQAHHEPSAARFPGGESLLETRDRAIQAVAEIRRMFPEDGATVAAVSHADPIRMALTHFLDMPFDSFHKLIIDTASVTALYFSKDHIRLTGMNLPPVGVFPAADA